MSTSSLLLIFSLFFACLPARAAEEAARTETAYERMLREERAAAAVNQEEAIIGGAAAVVIGLYGYYNTSPDPLVKMLYAATQTAGVLAVGQGIKDYHASSLLLDLDGLMTKHGEQIPTGELQASLLRHRVQKEKADMRTTATTASILALLYGYNGVRESDKTLRSIYFFLGFNFAAGGLYGFYKSHQAEKGGLSFDVLPNPSVTYHF